MKIVLAVVDLIHLAVPCHHQNWLLGKPLQSAMLTLKYTHQNHKMLSTTPIVAGINTFLKLLVLHLGTAYLLPGGNSFSSAEMETQATTARGSLVTLHL